jgi:hypothetical protein
MATWVRGARGAGGGRMFSGSGPRGGPNGPAPRHALAGRAPHARAPRRRWPPTAGSPPPPQRRGRRASGLGAPRRSGRCARRRAGGGTQVVTHHLIRLPVDRLPHVAIGAIAQLLDHLVAAGRSGAGGGGGRGRGGGGAVVGPAAARAARAWARLWQRGDGRGGITAPPLAARAARPGPPRRGPRTAAPPATRARCATRGAARAGRRAGGAGRGAAAAAAAGLLAQLQLLRLRAGCPRGPPGAPGAAATRRERAYGPNARPWARLRAPRGRAPVHRGCGSPRPRRPAPAGAQLPRRVLSLIRCSFGCAPRLAGVPARLSPPSIGVSSRGWRVGVLP